MSIDCFIHFNVQLQYCFPVLRFTQTFTVIEREDISHVIACANIVRYTYYNNIPLIYTERFDCKLRI